MNRQQSRTGKIKRDILYTQMYELKRLPARDDLATSQGLLRKLSCFQTSRQKTRCAGASDVQAMRREHSLLYLRLDFWGFRSVPADLLTPASPLGSPPVGS